MPKVLVLKAPRRHVQTWFLAFFLPNFGRKRPHHVMDACCTLLVFSGKGAGESHSSLGRLPSSAGQQVQHACSDYKVGKKNRGQELNTNFFSNLDIPARIQGCFTKNMFCWVSHKGHTELFGSHPFTWKIPTTPKDIRTKKSEFVLLLLAWKTSRKDTICPTYCRVRHCYLIILKRALSCNFLR